MNIPNSHKLLLLTLAGSWLAGCSEDFDPASRVTTFRVLAVQTDAPFAEPGQTVQLSALSYDPLARPVTWAWAMCDGAADSSVMACIQRFSEVSQAAGGPTWLAYGEGQNTAAVTIPADALDRLPPEARWQATVGVLSVACPGALEIDSANPELPFRCSDSMSGRELELDEYVIGVKRVSVRESDQNQNPVIERIEFDGADWPEGEVKEVEACDTDENDYTACSGSSLNDVAAIVSLESFESGRDEFQRDYSEQLVIQHYSTEGIFESEVRVADDPKTGWVARKSASGSELSLWFVARDDRGGVSWTERRVRVR